MNSSAQQHFLQQLAADVVSESGKNLLHHCFVFPSKRAGTFFLKYISQHIDKPLFAPHIITIQELSRVITQIEEVPMLTLACHMFNLLDTPSSGAIENKKEYPVEVRLDQCMRIIEDFNDIDNYLAPADKIFQNIQQLEELTSLDYLTDEQRRIICDFWKIQLPHSNKKEDLKQNYAALMERLRRLYSKFKSVLEENNIGYDGMIVRKACELSESALLSALKHAFPQQTHFSFAGLYALKPAEEQLLQHIKKSLPAGHVNFYWEDVKSFFAKESVGFSKLLEPYWKLIERNMSLLGGKRVTCATPMQPPQLHLVLGNARTVGHRALPLLIEEVLKSDPESINRLQTAIIVPNERALPQLISALSNEAWPLNITMGYPLSATNISVWVCQYIDYHLSHTLRNGRHSFSAEILGKLLAHPLSGRILRLSHQDENKKESMEVVQQLTSSLPYLREEDIVERFPSRVELLMNGDEHHPLAHIKDTEEFLICLQSMILAMAGSYLGNEEEELSNEEAVELEFIYFYKRTIDRLQNLFRELSNNIDVPTAAKLLTKLTEGVTVPFEGEPLRGLQIMGSLESRLLSFENLIIADANEGYLPAVSRPNTGYIPYSLRVGYNLPTYRHKELTESYYIYRLIFNAKKVFFVATDNGEKEVSRIVQQLQYLTPLHINTSNIQIPATQYAPQSIEIPKTGDVWLRMQQFLKGAGEQRYLSANSLNIYLTCPMQFYFSKICGIPEERNSDDLLSAIDFGQVLHRTMEALFKGYEGKEIDEELLKSWCNEEFLRPLVVSIYQDEVFKQTAIPYDPEGIHNIYINSLLSYLLSILRHDATLSHLSYLQSEKKFQFFYPISLNREVAFTGFIDRLDCVQIEGKPTVRIVDYKTGSEDIAFNDWAYIHQPAYKKPSKYKTKAISQLMLYSLYYISQVDNSKPVIPVVYALREMIQDPIAYEGTVAIKKKRPKKDENPLQPITDFRDDLYKVLYRERLTAVLEELFDPEIPFVQVEKNSMTCTFCKYNTICKRF